MITPIETKRLVLRGHTIHDFDALYTMWSEPAVYHHIIGRPSTREEAWNRLLRYSGHWALLGYGYPLNVRELEHALRAAVVLAFGGGLRLIQSRQDRDPPQRPKTRTAAAGY